MFDLPVTLDHIFNPVFSAKAAAQLGEEEFDVQKAMSGIIPVVLTGLLYRASNPPELDKLVGMARDAAGTNASQLTTGLPTILLTKGADILRVIFGRKMTDITASLANFARIKPASAEALMQAVAPVALGVAGQQAGGGQLSATCFLSFLNSQQEKILAVVPAGLGLSGILGLNNLGDIGRKLSNVVNGITGGTPEALRSPQGTKWLWMVIALAVILFLLWYLLRGCNPHPAATPVDSANSAHLETVAVNAVTEMPERQSVKVTLPDGKILDVYKGGIEDQLVSFLRDSTAEGGKDKWFDFDDLNFKTGSAELTEESLMQVQNMIAILNAFPRTKIKIGGYTDRVGDSVANIKLSKERADAVFQSLQAGHVRPVQLLRAEGYGSRFAKASADAPNEERKLDRRISLGVREK